jgi:hypothetical protein
VGAITAHTGQPAGMFDVLAWKDGDPLLVEAKRRGDDRTATPNVSGCGPPFR